MAHRAMLRHRGLWYLAAGLLFTLGARFSEPLVLRWLLAWFAISSLYIAAGYLFSFTGLLFKSSKGVVPLPVKLLLLPFFFATHLYNVVLRRTDPVPPIQEVAPGLFLGRRLFATDVETLKELNIGAVLDVTVEFDALDLSLLGTDTEYMNIPIFDHAVPRLKHLHRAVHWVDQQRRAGRRVLVHCALGRGRSSTVVIAYLLSRQPRADLRELISRVQDRRETVRPNFLQMRLLERYRQSEFIRAPRRAWLVINPVAGRGDHDATLEALREQLCPFLDLEIRQTTPDQGARHWSREAVAENADVVIAAGGDGTVSAVAEQLIGSDIALGIIPLGTANALATCLYGSAVQIDDSLTSAERIVRGETARIDTATCNGRCMLLMAGIGYERGMIERAERELKNRWGALAYLVSAAHEIREATPLSITLSADGETFRFQSDSVVVANGAPAMSVLAQGGGEPVYDDGKLDITWLESSERTTDTLISLVDLFRAGVMDTQTGDGVHHAQAKRIRIETAPETDIAIDGEVCERTPVDIEIRPLSLTVIADTPE